MVMNDKSGKTYHCHDSVMERDLRIGGHGASAGFSSGERGNNGVEHAASEDGRP